MCWVRCLRFSSIVLLVLAATPVRAQDAPAPEDRLPVALLTRPALLVEGIGNAHDAVATRSKDAQAFYDQGLAYGHSHLSTRPVRFIRRCAWIQHWPWPMSACPTRTERWMRRVRRGRS
jgi:hypothetical protein